MNREQAPLRLPTTIMDVKIIELQTVIEARGTLIIGEWSKQIPFLPKRFFVVSEVPPNESRSHHAHLAQHQFLIALRGVCTLVADDGRDRQKVILDRPNVGAYVPPQIWTEYLSSAEAILLVLASDLYDPSDYVNDHDEFIYLKWENA